MIAEGAVDDVHVGVVADDETHACGSIVTTTTEFERVQPEV